MVAGVAKRQKVIGTGKSVGKMDPRDNKKSKTLATNLAMRDKPKPQPQLFGATEATRTQRTTSDATQTTRSSSNKESGRRNNSHIHSINGQASNPATGLQTQITSALESSIGTTDAIPPGSERRSRTVTPSTLVRIRSTRMPATSIGISKSSRNLSIEMMRSRTNTKNVRHEKR